VFTTCQPEHGVPDYASPEQALYVRDSRGVPEFIFNPQLGESFQEALNIKGNPNYMGDWYTRPAPVTKVPYVYTTAHWAFTENRFRAHHKVVDEKELTGKIRLEDLLQLITQDDVVHRRFLDPTHRSYIPEFEVYTIEHLDNGKSRPQWVSRQMVLFCVERRKAWRMMQSRAGVINNDYKAQRELLDKIDKGEMTREEFLNPNKNIEVPV
jgi:pyruvate-ferredoxin/flavodoxin oxidoreductase